MDYQHQRTVKSKGKGRDRVLCSTKNIWYCIGGYAIILKNVYEGKIQYGSIKKSNTNIGI